VANANCSDKSQALGGSEWWVLHGVLATLEVAPHRRALWSTRVTARPFREGGGGTSSQELPEDRV
jgi:hypothetical protein